ncbi:hypothetical protein AMIS_31460 [Actinoplanes missouriensis 431]|uniref:Uncharacterized protein n=1 Tax=Actinoplanes missouriensis (strain ATCC 14538 / DSM 43046 / CBS 188.64 / JCM 3121 / NBRC 102363 / NCIMB 12654 / NRRL B-3342 / UNCC 431) TaxID=512565 RepID=I0H5S9_ACTM4|nr:hypothetical protein AMIS_31460 [Actinoplanes missouriensis 431]
MTRTSQGLARDASAPIGRHRVTGDACYEQHFNAEFLAFLSRSPKPTGPSHPPRQLHERSP